MTRWLLLCLCVVAIAGCAMGEGARWVSASNKTVTVEGVPYQVQYVRDAGGFDMRGVRTETVVVMPDAMVERRRNTMAAVQVASSMCPGAVMVSESKDGDMYATRVRCG